MKYNSIRQKTVICINSHISNAKPQKIQQNEFIVSAKIKDTIYWSNILLSLWIQGYIVSERWALFKELNRRRLLF